MARIVYRGAYATFPVVGLTPGDLAYATDLLILYEWSGVAWFPYHDYPDYEGGKSKLYTAADWAALQATDITFHSGLNNAAVLAQHVLDYAVPAGRTLYVTYFTISCYTIVLADADKPQIVSGWIQNFTTAVVLMRLGGNGGAQISLNKPVRIPGGNTVRFGVTNFTAHVADIWIAAGGYVI